MIPKADIKQILTHETVTKSKNWLKFISANLDIIKNMIWAKRLSTKNLIFRSMEIDFIDLKTSVPLGACLPWGDLSQAYLIL